MVCFRPRLGLGTAEGHHERREYQYVIGVAAGRGRSSAQLGAMVDRGLRRRRTGEDQVGVAGGQPDPGRGLPGLYEYRSALRRTRERQDSLHFVVVALEVGCVQLGSVAPDAVLAVAQDRVVVPAVP